MFGNTAGVALVDLLSDWGVERIYGMPGGSINSIDELLPAFESAIKQNSPCIIDVVVEVNEAPMPAKITFGQAADYTKHMIKELFEEGKIDLPPL